MIEYAFIRDTLEPIFDGHPDGMNFPYYREALADVMKPILDGTKRGERSKYYESINGIITTISTSTQYENAKDLLGGSGFEDLFSSVILEWRHELMRRVWLQDQELRRFRATGHGLEHALRRAKGEGGDLRKWRAARAGLNPEALPPQRPFFKDLQQWARTYQKLETLLRNFCQATRDEVVITHIFPQADGEEVVRLDVEDLAKWLSECPSIIQVGDADREDGSESWPFRIIPDKVGPRKRHVKMANSSGEMLRDYIQLLIRPTSYTNILADVRASLILRANALHGADGRIVMSSLLPVAGSEAVYGVSAFDGRPPDVFASKTALWLDRYRVPRQRIGALLMILDGQRPVEDESMRRRINQRIMRAGGNTLRYMADLYIRNRNLCADCTWGWDRAGKLNKVHSCGKRHPKSSDDPITFSIREGTLKPTTDDWLSEMLGLRKERHCRNALAWLMRKTT